LRAVVEKFVPTVAEAIDLIQGRVCLLDGTITPCWSYAENNELWSRKHGTTGFHAQLVCLLDGAAIYLRPAAGMQPRCDRHFATTPVAEIVAHSGGGIVDKGPEASAMAKRLIVCCDGTWNTQN
jgi:hypothetical protein